MGALTFTDEFSSPVPAKRMFTALILEADTLIPKLMPQAIKSIETTHVDGGPGTIKTITLVKGAQFKTLKHRIEAIDKENMTCSYSLIEGEALMDKAESIFYEIKFEPSSDGGCKETNISKYILKPGMEIPDEEIKAGKAKAMVVFKVVEAYLLANLTSMFENHFSFTSAIAVCGFCISYTKAK